MCSNGLQKKSEIHLKYLCVYFMPHVERWGFLPLLTLPYTRLEVGTVERNKLLETNRQRWLSFPPCLLLPVPLLTTLSYSSSVLPSMTLISL